jgi:hypothetical protein
MIESVDRIIYAPVRECPLLVEGVLSEGPIIETAWFTVEPMGNDCFKLTEADTGYSIDASGSTMLAWLQPEDMRDPVVQAEIIAGLAQMGIEL